MDLVRDSNLPGALNIQAVGGRHKPLPKSGVFYCALLVAEIYICKSIALGVAVRPLEVIHQAPVMVRTYFGSAGKAMPQMNSLWKRAAAISEVSHGTGNIVMGRGNLSGETAAGEQSAAASDKRALDETAAIHFYTLLESDGFRLIASAAAQSHDR
jgi:hypothetical protein